MLYEQLLERKKNGENITIKDLGYEELYQLYVIENKLDSVIGELCNNTKKNIRAKRHRLGITITCKTYEQLKKLGLPLI